MLQRATHYTPQAGDILAERIRLEGACGDGHDPGHIRRDAAAATPGYGVVWASHRVSQFEPVDAVLRRVEKELAGDADVLRQAIQGANDALASAPPLQRAAMACARAHAAGALPLYVSAGARSAAVPASTVWERIYGTDGLQ
jgi:hypothetical protein